MSTNLQNQTDDALAKIVWAYMCMNEPLRKADIILALGSHDIRVATRGAELFNSGFAPLIMFSGGFGRLTGDFKRPEAEMFAEEAIRMGVPREKIIIENRSTNTGENIRFSHDLLQQKGLTPKSYIVVTKPYMERRAYATFKKIFPTLEIVATSPVLDFDHYPTEDLARKDVINIMAGDLQRIKEYPAKGFQVEQKIPPDVWAAYEELVRRGYTDQLIQ